MAGTHFTIPTWFTAVDKMSGVVDGMGGNIERFAMRSEAGINRAERAFRKVTPALGEAQKQMLSMVGTAAVVGAAFAGAAFTVKGIKDYESELQNLRSVTGATDDQFLTFKGRIKDVANETHSSSVTVAQAFTAIANNQPELLKDAAALAAVTKSSILLAQASKMELQPAGEALTQILNQFGKGASEAAATIDILAAGSVAGSSEIRDTADAIQKFGTVAANAGIKINESVALIELSSKFEKGAEAGQKLRNILITMSTAKVQDPKAVTDMQRLGVNMDLVANKSLPLSVRLKEMAKLAKDDAALFHVFGKENQALATGILNTAGNFDKMLTDVGTSGKVAEMAAANNKTLDKSIERLGNAWTTMMTTSEGASTGLSVFTKATEWLTRNLDTVLTVGLTVVGLFTAWWAIMKVARIGLLAYNIGLGIYNAITKTSTVYTAAQTAAQTAHTVVTNVATAAQWALNAAMMANPIMLIVGALLALAAAVSAGVKHYQMLEEVHKKAAAASKVSAIEKETAAVQKLSAAYQEVGMSKAEADKKATSDRVANLNKTSAILKEDLIEKHKAVVDAYGNTFSQIKSLFTGDQELKDFMVTRGALNASEGAKAALLNPKAAQTSALSQTINNNTNKKITMDFKNLPKGVEVSEEGGGGDVIPSSSSTMSTR